MNSNINGNVIKVLFPYNVQTQIKDLIDFVHRQIQDNSVYVKSQNFYVDYVLGLMEFRVRKLVELLKEEQNGKQASKNRKKEGFDNRKKDNLDQRKKNSLEV